MLRLSARQGVSVSLFSKRDKGGMDRRRSLAGVPVLGNGVEIQRGEDGLVTLHHSGPRGPGFLDRFRPPVIRRRFELDAFGTFVVDAVDGHRTVLEIICAFEREFGMSHREAELGVVAFLKMLMQRRLIAVAVAS
jgi:hypothetical protein